MRRYDQNNVPTHLHDCNECKFLFGVVLYDDHTKMATLDVYEQCNNIDPEVRYLLRYSSEDPDYISGVTLQHLVAGYFEARNPNLGKEVKPK